MERIKIINPKSEIELSAKEAATLNARISLGYGQIYFVANEEGRESKIFATTIPSQDEGGMQELFWEYPIFSLPYKSTTITVNDGAPFVIIPDDLVDSTSPEEWLSLSADTEGRRVLTQALSEERISVVYSIRKELFDFCKRSFSIPLFTHNVSTQIIHTIRQTRIKSPKILSAYIDRNFIQIVVSDSGELLLANRYRIGSDADCLYYLTAIYRQFSLDPHVDPIYLYSCGYYIQFIEELKKSIDHVHLNNYPTHEGSSTYTNGSIHPLELLYILCES